MSGTSKEESEEKIEPKRVIGFTSKRNNYRIVGTKTLEKLD